MLPETSGSLSEQDQILPLALPATPGRQHPGVRPATGRERRERPESSELQKLSRKLKSDERTIALLQAQQLQYQKERDYVVADLAVRDAYIADLRRRLQERVAALDGELATLRAEVDRLQELLSAAHAQLHVYHHSRRYRLADRVGTLFGRKHVKSTENLGLGQPASAPRE